ncbi:chorismate mutase [Sciscionella marina]|uniref:chorismate mutase n=1 Tax=Sciscionella marina TaxID=508770 RepID=UPI0003759EC5|nr:chorismate mutase [Sciscionella marina]
MQACYLDELEALRRELDELDTSIVDLLAKRFEVTGRVGVLKRDADVAAVDHEREREMFARLRDRARDKGISPELVESLYRLIVSEVVVGHRRAREG